MKPDYPQCRLVLVGLSVAIVCGLWSKRTEASPHDLFEAGARGSALAGAGAVDAEGPMALYYNPAALVLSKPRLTGGVLTSTNQSYIHLEQRPSKYDIPNLGEQSPTMPTEKQRHPRKRDTTDPPSMSGIYYGGSTGLGTDRFRFSGFVFMPVTGLADVGTHYPDERERYFSNKLRFEFTSQSPRTLDLELGAAFKAFEWLSIGAGGTVYPGATTNLGMHATSLDRADEDLNANLSVDTGNGWGFLAGLVATPFEQLELGLSYRSEVLLEIQGSHRTQVGTNNPKIIEKEFNWVPLYVPEMGDLSAGLALDPFQIYATLRYTRWSEYLNTHGRQTDFEDTFSPRLGVEYRANPATEIRAGLGWIPSPVPDQTGRTNYVDNNRLLASGGAGHTFDSFGQSLRVDWSLQYQYFQSRHTAKNKPTDPPNCTPDAETVCDETPDNLTDPDTGNPFPEAQGLQTGNPGFPGFSSGGWIAALQVQISWFP